MTDHLTAFSWGYEGWGSAPEKFVEAADAVEASRGFGPPIFVEVRFKRTGRAPGFKEKAFEKLLGPERYRWMKVLGNEGIDDGGYRLHKPADAKLLLDLVQELGVAGRRVLFFCHCAFPGHADSPRCHRLLVADGLLGAARQRRLPLVVVEWPGGEPDVRTIHCSDALVESALSGRKYFDFPDGISVVEAAAVPFCTRLRLVGPTSHCTVTVEPARFHAGKWGFVAVEAAVDEDERLAQNAERRRRSRGLDARRTAVVAQPTDDAEPRTEAASTKQQSADAPRRSAPTPEQPAAAQPRRTQIGYWQKSSPPAIGREPDRGGEGSETVARERAEERPVGSSASRAIDLYPECVYTIVHLDKLKGFSANEVANLEERTRWTRAAKILKASEREDKVVAVLFADARECSKLTHAAVLTRVEVDEKRTSFGVTAITPIPRGHSPQELVSLGTGRTIAPGYIRPYVPCKTPKWAGRVLTKHLRDP